MAIRRKNKNTEDPYIALSNKIEEENLIFAQKRIEQHNLAEKIRLEKEKRKQEKSEVTKTENISIDDNAEIIPDIIVPTKEEIKKTTKKVQEEINIENESEIIDNVELSEDEIKNYNPDINLSNKNISGILSILGADDLVFGELETEAKNLEIDLDELEEVDEVIEEIVEEEIEEVEKEESQPTDEYDLNLAMLEESDEVSKEEKDNHNQSVLKVIYSVFEKSKSLVALVKNDKIEYMNKNGIQYLEANSSEDVLGKQFFEFVAEKDWNLLAENIGTLLMNEDTISLTLVTMKHQETKAKLSAIYIPDEEDFSFILIADIQGNEEATRKVDSRQMAYLSDGITGLPSFYVFQDRVQVALGYRNLRDKPSPIALIAINIDKFGEIIKNNLASVSDSILQQMSNRIAIILRKTNTITRGDKNDFWIMINDLKDENELEETLKELHKSISEDYIVDDEIYSLSSSIGASIYPKDAKRKNKLIRITEETVDKAKAEGGNKYLIYDK